jgi:FkbM family methyltransferase
MCAPKGIFSLMTQLNASRKFVPYTTTIELSNSQFHFFHATPEAQEWYDPLKPYARVEYDWVIENVAFSGRNFFDAGAHHGQYSVVVGTAYRDCRIVSVDALEENIDITEVNLRLNRLEPELVKCVLSNQDGDVRFSNPNDLVGSNGRIVETGGLIMPTKRLIEILPDAHVIKLDIEGEEFDIIPNQIDEMIQADTWIVEVHPFSYQAKGKHPDILIEEFTRRGYEILWVNRKKNRVEPYSSGTQWDIHSTIFAINQ